MNKKFIITIPLKNEKKKSIKLSVNTMLTPFYISETALLSVYMEEEEYETYREKAREIIFNASLRADEYTYNKLGAVSDEHKLLLKRELALCFALNTFSRHFYKGFHDTLHRSKSFADFTVTTTVKNNPALLKDMIANSNDCIKEAKKAIKDISAVDLGLGRSMVKGKLNPANSFSYRLWIHNMLPEKSNALFASEKIWLNGNMYKDGVRNVSNPGINYNRRNI